MKRKILPLVIIPLLTLHGCICRSGNTGRGTGAHLHFTLTDPDGAKIDPQTMFDFKA